MRYKPRSKVECFLDSGAFSAWTKQVEIDIDAYISFIKEHSGLFDYYFSLDVIPGARGRKPTNKEIAAAAAASYKNHQYMKKAGLTPIPTFHIRESVAWLKRYLDDGESYIALGGLVGQPASEVVPWLDGVWELLTDSKGYPRVRVHGLGLSSFSMMRRYPWTSCDATSWALMSAFGQILVPVYRSGRPDYLAEPLKVIVSERARGAVADDSVSGFLENSGGVAHPPTHYLAMGSVWQARVVDFLENHVGTTIAKVTESYEERAFVNVFVYMQFQEACKTDRFVPTQSRSLLS